MTSYRTKPIIDSIINNLSKLEDQPADKKSLDEIEQLLCDELERVRHIQTLLYDYRRLSEIEAKITLKLNELESIFGN